MMKVASLAVCLAIALGTAALAAEDPERNVCVVTYSTLGHAKNGFSDVPFIAAANLMPRVSAEKLLDDYTAIFTYPDLASTITACQCLANPLPANSMPQRYKSLAACPKPATDR